jgi:hypothetical protein
MRPGAELGALRLRAAGIPSNAASLVAQVIATVVNSCSFHSIDLFLFESDRGRRHYQAFAKTTEGPEAFCLFSLPVATRNVYITLFEENRVLMESVLAVLEELESQQPVNAGTCVLLNYVQPTPTDIVGVLLLPPQISGKLARLPSTITPGAQSYSFLLVVCLTSETHRILEAEGIEALLRFLSTRRCTSLDPRCIAGRPIH